MTDALSLLLNMISSTISWFFTINFGGIYIGWILVTGVLIGLLLKFFLQNRGGEDNG